MNFMHACELLHAHNEKFYREINYFRGGPNIMGVQIFRYSLSTHTQAHARAHTHTHTHTLAELKKPGTAAGACMPGL